MLTKTMIAAETVVRMIVIVLQILGIIGGGLLIGLTSTDTSENAFVLAVGGTVISIGGLALIYEVIMIVLSFMEKINHSVRLLVDVILSSVAAVLCFLATLLLIVLAVILIAFLLVLGGVIVLVLFLVPIGCGILNTAVYIASAITSGRIRSKLRSQTRDQTVPAVGTTPTTFVMVQQPIPSQSDALSNNYAYGVNSSYPQAHYYSPMSGGLAHPQVTPAAGPTSGGVDVEITVEDPYYSYPHPPKDAGVVVATEAKPVDGDAPPSYETVTS